VQSDCKKPTLPLKENTPAGLTSTSKIGVDGEVEFVMSQIDISSEREPRKIKSKTDIPSYNFETYHIFSPQRSKFLLILQYRVATGRSNIDYQAEHPHPHPHQEKEKEETKDHKKPLQSTSRSTTGFRRAHFSLSSLTRKHFPFLLVEPPPAH
jgi:hypothetical protein